MYAASQRVVGAAAVLIFLSVPVAPASSQGGAESLEARVDAVFGRWDNADSAGCAVGVYRDGSLAYARGYGLADLERRVPIAAHTVFDIGSTSKQFAAASILLLEQQGRLSLDDEVHRHVPELPEYSRPITIRHLLHHTSGLRDYIGLVTLGGARIDDVTTAEDALAAITRQKALNFDPGDEHLYSNSGYFLLSIIVERTAGQSLRDFARENIFEPLGMERTHYLGSYDDIVPDRAMAYSPAPGGGLRTDMSRWLQLGDGAVFTTVEELLLWDRNFYDAAVGGPSMVAAMQTPGTLTNGEALTYGLGLITGVHRGLRTVSHGGSWGGYRAELLRFPDQHFSVAVLCNLGSTGPSQLATQVADIYLADVLAPAARAAAGPEWPAPGAAGPSVTLSADALRELAGTYRQATSRTIRTIQVHNDSLILAAGGARYRLHARSTTEFDLQDAPVEVTLRFEAASEDESRRLHWTVQGQPPLTFHKLELVTPDPTALAAYTGAFYSEELEATYTLELADGALTLHRRGAPPQALRPMVRDEFLAGPATLTFSRDADGTITGYALDLGRIRNLRFERVR